MGSIFKLLHGTFRNKVWHNCHGGIYAGINDTFNLHDRIDVRSAVYFTLL